MFRTPGENQTPVVTDLTQEEWIEYARPVWYGIRETDVLSTVGSRDNDDERHLCPLQLPVIRHCVRLWSGPGEVVLSPFAGIGSEGVESILQKRKFVGIELKPVYFRVACENLRRAEHESAIPTLFDEVG